MEFLGLSVLLAAAVVVPVVLGLIVDSARHSAPAFFFVGLVVGLVAAGAAFWTRFKQYF
jgi:F0F1-type ATP synthase assembly protein I